MDNHIVFLKKKIRAEALRTLLSMDEDQRRKESFLVCNKIRSSSLWKNSKKVFAYAPMNSELDIWGLLKEAIEEGKIIALPFYVKQCDIYEPRIIRDLNKEIVIGKMGIREPDGQCEKAGLEEFDLILVPGVAFSSTGYRLGRGKGYYDKMLTRARGIKCGVCFNCQYGWDIPVEPHDVKLDCIVTPSLWWSLEASSEER